MDSRKFTLLNSQTVDGDECIVSMSFEEGDAVLPLNSHYP
jgi:hypothetical protein